MNDKGAQSTDFERMIWAAAWAVALRNGNLAIDAMREAHTAVSAFRNLVENDQRISPAERKFLEGLLGSGPQHRSKTVIESVACPGPPAYRWTMFCYLWRAIGILATSKDRANLDAFAAMLGVTK